MSILGTTLPCFVLCLSYFVCNDPEKGFVRLVLRRTMVPITISRRRWVGECSDFVIASSQADGLSQNRFRGLDLVDRVPEELWMEVPKHCIRDSDQNHPKEKEMEEGKVVP